MSKVELNISDENKEKLKCSYCDGYLSCAPIQILPNGENICGNCVAEDNILTYRNTALEALLQDASFPCKYSTKGCPARLHFLSNLDHEQNCTFNKPEPEPSTSETVDYPNMDVDNKINRGVSEKAIKSSASTCGQQSTHSNHDNGHSGIPKVNPSVAGTAMGTNSSVCSDTPTRVTLQRHSTARRSTRLRSFGSMHNYDRFSNQAPSVASNENGNYWNRQYNRNNQQRPYDVGWRFNNLRSTRLRSCGNEHNNDRFSNQGPSATRNENRNHWNRPYNGNNQQRPYDVGWEFNNLFNRRGGFRSEHVMYTPRNRVIIINGGTFYVNW